MRTRCVSFFVTLILIVPTDLFGQRNEGETALSLRQVFEGDLLNLERNLGVGEWKSKMKTLSVFERDFESRRKKAARQHESDELFFDQVLGVLSEIPRSSRLESSHCSDLRAQILDHFEPTSEGKPRNPAVQYGIKILGQLCAQK